MLYSYTFNLKNPKADGPTLIYLRANIRAEGKYLKYSTGESIHPKDWDNKKKFPIKVKGRSALAVKINSIINQLTRYEDQFQLICNRIESQGDIITVKLLKQELDYEFKKSSVTVSYTHLTLPTKRIV